MDGGSTDKTIDILKSYGKKIRWVSEKDHGQSHAINKGLRLCSGEVCGFLNSDDYFLLGALDCIAETFNNEQVLWVTGGYKIVDAEGNSIQSLVVAYKDILRILSSRNILLLTNYIVQPSTFWRNSLMEKTGFFDENLYYAMDYDYWLRAFQISPPRIIRKPLSAFRIHDSSKGGSQYEAQFAEEMAVLRQYTHNKILIGLHRIHNAIIIGIYKKIK